MYRNLHCYQMAVFFYLSLFAIWFCNSYVTKMTHFTIKFCLTRESLLIEKYCYKNMNTSDSSGRFASVGVSYVFKQYVLL